MYSLLFVDKILLVLLTGNAAANFYVTSKIAENAIKKYEHKKGAIKLSVKLNRKKAGWTNGCFTTILTDAH